jgi:hypothetical protein
MAPPGPSRREPSLRHVSSVHVFPRVYRAFRSECRLAQAQGQLDRAIQSSLDSMEMASKMSIGGGLIDRLVALACDGMGFVEAERLALDLPREAVPTALVRVRQIRQSWPTMTEMIEAERLSTVSMLTEVFQEMEREPFLKQLDSVRPDKDSPSVWMAVRRALTPRRIVIENQERY